MQQTETSIQMIKMINEFKLTVVHFARSNPPAQTRSVDARGFTAGQKNCGKSGLGRWAVRGRWAAEPRACF